MLIGIIVLAVLMLGVAAVTVSSDFLQPMPSICAEYRYSVDGAGRVPQEERDASSIVALIGAGFGLGFRCRKLANEADGYLEELTVPPTGYGRLSVEWRDRTASAHLCEPVRTSG